MNIKINPFLYLNFKKFLIICVFIFISLISCLNYSGSKFFLLGFNFFSFLIVLKAVSKNAYFFDILLAFYLTIGFFLKFNFGILFKKNYFENILPFVLILDIDRALLASSIAFIAILFAGLVFQYFFHKNLPKVKLPLNLIYSAYYKHRLKIILFILFVVFFINITNAYYEIYTKGGISSHSPLILGIYKYLISFGLTFLLLFFLQIELYKKNKFPILFASLIFIENMLSSASQFSRGMILTSSAIMLGIYKHCKFKKINLPSESIIYLLIFIFILFSFAFQFSQISREKYFMSVKVNSIDNIDSLKDRSIVKEYLSKSSILETLVPLMTDRMIGIESVIAVSSSKQLSWNFFTSSLKEKDIRGLSFYDRHILNWTYADTDFTKKQFITLPGFIAFFFYSGSLFTLFLFIACLSFIGYFFEWFALYITSKNYIVASFISNLFVYRLINFGYIPLNTIKYYIAILFTLIFYFILFKFLHKALNDINYKQI